jgi:deoxyadenosine/deoxycytidine kinase
MNSHSIRILTLEGNIGAGKSTFLGTLKERYADRSDILFLLEPVGIWESVVDENGLNMLQKFYQNPSKYSFAFQVLAFSSRLKLIKNAIESAPDTVTTIVMERSLDADRAIFAQMLHDDGQMEKCEFDIYKMMSDEAMQSFSADGILWLNVGPETCLERIHVRDREGESGISLAYLEKCDMYHQQWLGADLGFVLQVEDSRSDDEAFWKRIDKYILQID